MCLVELCLVELCLVELRLVVLPGAPRRDLIERGPQPRERGAEIFRALPVEALLMDAEARDAGPDLILDLAVDDRPRERSGRRQFDGLDRFRLGLNLHLDLHGPDLGRRLEQRHGGKPGLWPCGFPEGFP
jgi:hypothetical protein